MRNSAKWFLLLHLILGVYASSSVCSKLAAQQPFLSVGFILLYGGMLVALELVSDSAIVNDERSKRDSLTKLYNHESFYEVIKHLPLTTAYANKAITVVWGILLGFLLFGESITLRQFIGAAVIIVGIVLFVRADNEGEGGQ